MSSVSADDTADEAPSHRFTLGEASLQKIFDDLGVQLFDGDNIPFGERVEPSPTTFSTVVLRQAFSFYSCIVDIHCRRNEVVNRDSLQPVQPYRITRARWDTLKQIYYGLQGQGDAVTVAPTFIDLFIWIVTRAHGCITLTDEETCLFIRCNHPEEFSYLFSQLLREVHQPGSTGTQGSGIRPTEIAPSDVYMKLVYKFDDQNRRCLVYSGIQ